MLLPHESLCQELPIDITYIDIAQNFDYSVGQKCDITSIFPSVKISDKNFIMSYQKSV